MDILKSIVYPEEVYALFKFKFGGSETVMQKCDLKNISTTLKRCYELLNMTSCSFSAVIQALDVEVRHAVCIFYLVLRALDTVEDDLSIPNKTKVLMLKSFHKNLYNPVWKFMESSEKDKLVLEEFPVISAEFRTLSPIYQKVIGEICHQMGEGMTLYLDKVPETDSMEQWDEYCHYVSGLVGIGLSELFAASKLESKNVGDDKYLSNSMGLFLIKAHVIRDFLEDVQLKRDRWPKEAWGKYGKQQIDLSLPQNRQVAVWCLNELVTNALQHLPDVLKYLGNLQNQSIFNFCAIPQVMAIATLERCYNNPAVFEGEVKIRKGEAVKMMMEATNMDRVKSIITHFTKKIAQRVPQENPLCTRTSAVVEHVLGLSQTDHVFVSSSAFLPIYVSCTMLVGAIIWQYRHGISGALERFTD